MSIWYEHGAKDDEECEMHQSGVGLVSVALLDGRLLLAQCS